MEQTHLSPQAHQRLVEELEERTGPRRREISGWIERAREHGDIKENADYDAAKTEQGHNEARVRQLEAILKTAIVVESSSTDKVETGTLVEVRMKGDDETSTYLIGSIEEKGRGYDVISPGSPLGKALLGHGRGDVVSYEAPGGQFEVEIVTVGPPG
ncbi:MAG TPA: transcription elongation factor GreA [Acidimicrobiia bacterium]|jgi:transcription elongation factor GreA|nr:transcription elongation factor GreA [Acidimicrobiia bacterium]